MDITRRLRNHALPDACDEREVMHAPLLREAADEIERLKKALAAYGKNPDECKGPDGACVSHMAYEELTAQIRAAGWQWDDCAESWVPPIAARAHA